MSRREFRKVFANREMFPFIVILQHGNRQVFQIISAGRSSSRFARRLDGGQQQGHQNANNPDHDQEFYERKPLTNANALRRSRIVRSTKKFRSDSAVYHVARFTATAGAVITQPAERKLAAVPNAESKDYTKLFGRNTMLVDPLSASPPFSEPNCLLKKANSIRLKGHCGTQCDRPARSHSRSIVEPNLPVKRQIPPRSPSDYQCNRWPTRRSTKLSGHPKI